MTLATTDIRFSSVGDGSTTAFTYPRAFRSLDDIAVVLVTTATGAETAQVRNTHYTISGVSDGVGGYSSGTVTMVTAPTASQTLVRYRDPALTQPTDAADLGTLPLQAIENQFDLQEMKFQRLDDRLDRAVRMREGDITAFDPRLPWLGGATAGQQMVVAAGALSWTLGNPTGTVVSSALSSFIAAGSTDIALGYLNGARLGVNVRGSAGALGDGATNDSTAIATADAAAQATSPAQAIFFPPGVYPVASNLTITSPVVFAYGARLKPASGVTVTLNGYVYAPEDAYIFDVSASGSFAGTGGGTPRVYPRWFGAVGDGTTSDDTPVWAAEALARAFGATFYGSYDAGLVYKLANLKTFTGAAVYRWKNIRFSKPSQTSTTQETLITITGADFGSAITLGSNAALGATTLSLSSATGVAVNDVFLLISNAEYGSSYDVITINKSEWVRCRSIVSTTLTLAEPLESSYLTADSARIYEFFETTEIHFEDVDVMGGGTGLQQAAIRFNKCTIHRFDRCRTINNEYLGFTFNLCSFREPISFTAEGADLTGYGYGGEFVGCNNPLVDFAAGRSCRHLVSMGASYQTTLPSSGGDRYIMGRGGHIGPVTCDTATGSPLDVHPGAPGGVLTSVSGSCLPGTTQESLTIQSADWAVGPVKVIGADQGILVQCWGKPTDELPPAVTLGACDLGRMGTGSNYALLVQNFDDDNETELRVSAASLNADAPGLLCAQSETSSGHTTATVGHLTGRSRTTHSVLANSSSGGMARIYVQRADFQEDAGNASIYAINSDGDLRNTAVGGFGALVEIGSGYITADNTAFRANDGMILLGRLVSLAYVTFKSEAGIGTVKRIMAATDAGVTNVLSGSTTWNPGSIADGDEEVVSITVTGAALGDFVTGVSFSLDVQDLQLSAQVTAADTVKAQLLNNTGGAIDLGSGTVSVRVTKNTPS